MSVGRATRRAAFDPFEFAPLFRWARQVRTRWVALTGVVIGIALVGATSFDDTLGIWADFQPISDIRRVFDRNFPTPSAAEFSFLRDVTTWFLCLVVVTTCMLVHKQWQLMRDAIPVLMANGVLKLKSDSDLSRGSGSVLLPRSVRRGPDRTLTVLVGAVNDFGRKFFAKGTLIVAAVSVFLAYSLMRGEKEHGLFRVIMPPDLTEQQQTDWLDNAYRNWWASDHHVIGNFTYLFVAMFASYVILMQNLVGVTCAYLAICLPRVVNLDADWLNRDGRFGWTPVARIFRTVYWSLALHGLTLSVILVILGVENFPWVLGLVLIWVVVVPTYLLLPWLVFRKVEAQARDRRLQRLGGVAARTGLDTEADVAKLHTIIVEIERTRHAKIRPMRLRATEFSTFAVVVLLPVALTAAQIFFSIRFGGN